VVWGGGLGPILLSKKLAQDLLALELEPRCRNSWSYDAIFTAENEQAEKEAASPAPAPKVWKCS
jgi:hypothetical protein